MYYNKCCVPGCASKRQDVKLHKFPSSEKGRKLWLIHINCSKLSAISVAELCKLCVCHKHFEARFIKKTSRLYAEAYPSLFSEDEIASGKPKCTNKENVTPEHNTLERQDHLYMKTNYTDHNYAKKKDPLPSTSKAPIQCSMNEIIQPVFDYISDPLPSTSKAPIQCSKNEIIQPVLDLISSPAVETMDKGTSSQPKRGIKRKRVIVRRVSKLGEDSRTLYKEFRKVKKQLHQTKKEKKLKKMSKEDAFKSITSKINPTARKIMWMQIKQCSKKKQGRRFTDDEKLIALAIQKQSPRAYKFLQKIFILPSDPTLKKFVSSLVIGPGINTQIFNAIKQEVTNWNDTKKYCSIIFDEMSLETFLTYTYKDQIDGFVDLAERKCEFADHVLVFMVKGAVYKWQQPIAYYFCQGATKAPELKSILVDIIKAVGSTGLLPIALISDQGTAFQSALKMLQQDTRRKQLLADELTDDTIQVGDYELSVLFDPPHLIKGLRNNFLTKNINFDDGKLAKWDDIVDVYLMDCQHAENRILHKLNDEHVLPNKIKKMKVRNCVRVFSHTMSSALAYTSAFPLYPDGKPISPTMKNTSEIIRFFDQLFDSVNGSSTNYKKTRGKKLRQAVRKNSCHHDFWKKSIKKLEKIRFVNAADGKLVSVPSLKNWIVTLKSMQRLWQFFDNKGIKLFRPRFFNSDGIENFFGRVRSYNFRNNNPDCHSFAYTFKSLLITGFIKFHSNTFNCEDESCYQLLSIKSLFENQPPRPPTETRECSQSSGLMQNDDNNVSDEDICTIARRERLKVHARAYTAGWVIRKIITRTNNCQQCRKDMTTNCSDAHKWVKQKEYSDDKSRLIYASEQFVMLFGKIIENTNLYLDSNAHERKISKKIYDTIMSSCTFEFLNCSEHKKDVIQSFTAVTIKLGIHNWCNIINKILKGTDIVRLEKQSKKSNMFNKALAKYRKKLKKNPNK